MKTVEQINKDLKNLYEINYKHLAKELIAINKEIEDESKQATNPLLLKVNEHYISADLKIMLFGQETNCWLGERNDGAFLGEIQPVIDLYDDFYTNDRCFTYGGQFWNGVKRLKTMLQQDIPNKKIGFLWNNVVKIGQRVSGFPYKINHITNQYFNVIKEEIQITEPDILIFLSGPRYDNELSKIFGDYTTERMGSFSERQLCKIECPDIPTGFRTYHPNYLWRNGIDKYFNAIIEEIK